MKITSGLMLAENLGAVHDMIDALHELDGAQRPAGNFLDGFTELDFRRLENGEGA